MHIGFAGVHFFYGNGLKVPLKVVLYSGRFFLRIRFTGRIFTDENGFVVVLPDGG